MKTIRSIILFAAITMLLLVSNAVYPQQGYNSYFLRSLPQSANVNPANTLPYSYYIGMPGLSGFQLNIENSGFTIDDVITKTPDDSLHFNINDFFNEIKDNNYLSTSLDDDLLIFGFRTKKGYFRFNISERFSANILYTKEMLNLFINGNEQYLGKTTSFKGMGLNINYYHEIGLAYSRPIDKQWTAGIKLKYLSGIANIYSKKSDISLYTAPLDYALTVKTDLEFYTSLPGSSMLPDDTLDFNIKGKEFSKSLTKFKNNGLAVDLGVNYQMNDKFSFGASIIDLGYINWKNNTKNLKSRGGNHYYTFKGIDINEFFNSDSTDFNDQVTEVLDSLKHNLGLNTSYDKYRSNLISKIYLSGLYNPTLRDHVGFLLRNDIFQGEIKTALTLHYNHEFEKILTLMTGYTMMTNNYFNLGFGFGLNAGSVQFYTFSDNVMAFFGPYSSKYNNVNFGINFVFGDNRDFKLHKAEGDSLATDAYQAEEKTKEPKPNKAEKKQQKADEKAKLKQEQSESQKAREEEKAKIKNYKQQQREYRRMQKKKGLE